MAAAEPRGPYIISDSCNGVIMDDRRGSLVDIILYNDKYRLSIHFLRFKFHVINVL